MDGIRVHGPNYRARAAVSKRGMDSVLGLSKTWRVVVPSQPQSPCRMIRLSSKPRKQAMTRII